MTQQFDSAIVEMVRRAVREQRWDLLYVMVAADDGGQSYEMKCEICGEFGNILANKFVHDAVCPVEAEENKLYGQS